MARSDDQWGYGDSDYNDDDIIASIGDDELLSDDLLGSDTSGDEMFDEELLNDIGSDDIDLFEEDDADIFADSSDEYDSNNSFNTSIAPQNYEEDDEDDNFDEDKIKSFLSRIEADGQDGDFSLIKEQAYINKQALSGADIPDDVSLIDEAIIIDEGAPVAGDTYNLARITVIVVSILIIIVSISTLSFISSQVYNNHKKEQKAIAEAMKTPGNNSPGIGEPLTVEDKKDSDLEDDSSDESSNSSDSDVEVPTNGSLVRYEITTEGNISQVSLAYIDGKGNAEPNVNVDLPWNKTIGMEEGFVPQLRANSKGTGTITCSINVDGKAFSKRSSSGDDPKVDCLEKEGSASSEE